MTFKSIEDDRYVGTPVAAQMMGLSEPTVRKLCHSGELLAYRVGKLYKVSVLSIGDFRKRHAVAPPVPREETRRPKQRRTTRRGAK
jgi:excisionase family DNA binding protein